MKKLIFIPVLFLALLLATSASATIVNINDSPALGGEPSLWQIYNMLYIGAGLTSSTDLMARENDFATSVGLYTSNAGTGTISARYSGAPVDLYTYVGGNPGVKTLIASFPASSGMLSVPFSIPGSGIFGFMANPTYPNPAISYDWYSQKELNYPNDGAYHFVVLNTPVANKYLVGFEDMKTGGLIESDWDYQDAVFEFTNIRPVTPEPASVALLGMGLVGLVGRKLRRKFMA